MASLTWDDIFAAVIGVEGGFTDNPSDPGNWTGGRVGAGTLRGTKYGIAAASFPTLDIKNLTLAAAQAIYRPRYYDRIGGDALPPAIALEAFDCAVNQGIGFAAPTLQLAASVTPVDGAIGPESIATIRKADPAAVVQEFAARRALRYAHGNIAEFGLGWMRRLMRITAQALA